MPAKSKVTGGSPAGFLKVLDQTFLAIDSIFIIMKATGRGAAGYRAAYKEANRFISMTFGNKAYTQVITYDGMMITLPIKADTVVRRIEEWRFAIERAKR